MRIDRHQLLPTEFADKFRVHPNPPPAARGKVPVTSDGQSSNIPAVAETPMTDWEEILEMALKSNCNLACNDHRTRKQADECHDCPVRDLAICATLDNTEIEALAQFVATQTFKSGDELFSEADVASVTFTVTSGAVKTHKLMADGRRQVTGFFFPGDFVGLTHGDTYPFTAEAVGDVKACRFDRRQLEDVMEEFPQLRQRLLNDASDELAAAHQQMLLLGRKTAQERLATFLLSIDEKTHDWRADEDTIALQMTRTDVADYLGLTTETVSRTFTQFRKNGYIESHGTHDIVILNKDALEDIAES